MDSLLQGTAPLMAVAFELWGSPTTWLEIVACTLAVWMVVCNMRVDPLGWPLAMASSLLYALLFAQSRLYGEAGLQKAVGETQAAEVLGFELEFLAQKTLSHEPVHADLFRYAGNGVPVELSLSANRKAFDESRRPVRAEHGGVAIHESAHRRRGRNSNRISHGVSPVGPHDHFRKTFGKAETHRVHVGDHLVEHRPRRRDRLIEDGKTVRLVQVRDVEVHGGKHVGKTRPAFGRLEPAIAYVRVVDGHAAQRFRQARGIPAR